MAEKFDMDEKPVSPTAAAVSDLLLAIAKDPGHTKPNRPGPDPESRTARRPGSSAGGLAARSAGLASPGEAGTPGCRLTPGRLLPRATKAHLEGHKAAPNVALQSTLHRQRGERMRRASMAGCVGGRGSFDAGICPGAIDDNGASKTTMAGTTSTMSDRLTSAAKFVTALHVATRKGPSFWRRASMIGKSAGIEDPIRLERAVQDAALAGLVERRASEGLVKLTVDGRGLGA